jgi:hypothetical protein
MIEQVARIAQARGGIKNQLLMGARGAAQAPVYDDGSAISARRCRRNPISTAA